MLRIDVIGLSLNKYEPWTYSVRYSDNEIDLSNVTLTVYMNRWQLSPQRRLPADDGYAVTKVAPANME